MKPFKFIAVMLILIVIIGCSFVVFLTIPLSFDSSAFLPKYNKTHCPANNTFGVSNEIRQCNEYGNDSQLIMMCANGVNVTSDGVVCMKVCAGGEGMC